MLHSENEIDEKRGDWQYWLSVESPHLNTTIDDAYSILAQRGLAPPLSFDQRGAPLPDAALTKRGIVITFYPLHVAFLKGSIRLLRKHGCWLPIEVIARNEELDLPEFTEYVSELQDIFSVNSSSPDWLASGSSEYGHVTLRFADDPKNYLPIPRGPEPRAAYHIKASAMINSRFEEILGLDVDMIALKNPEYLFDLEEYEDDGTIFFPDYWKTHTNNPVWRWMGVPCLDEWEQESGVMVIDRRRAWAALHFLWYVHRDHKIRDWHRFSLGDKDMFRFTWKATHTSHHFVQHWLVPGGYMVPDDGSPNARFCGIAMMQHDPRGRVLFAHINLLKHNDKRRFFNDTTNLPLWHLKRYKRSHSYIEPPGPEPGTKLSWWRTRGFKAIFPSINGHNCVDILAGYTGIEQDEIIPGTHGEVREVEIVDLETAIAEDPVVDEWGNDISGSKDVTAMDVPHARSDENTAAAVAGHRTIVESIASALKSSVEQNPPVPPSLHPGSGSVAMDLWKMVQPLALHDLQVWSQREEFERNLQRARIIHVLLSIINPLRLPCKLGDPGFKKIFEKEYGFSGSLAGLEPPFELPREESDHGLCVRFSWIGAAVWWLAIIALVKKCVKKKSRRFGRPYCCCGQAIRRRDRRRCSKSTKRKAEEMDGVPTYSRLTKSPSITLDIPGTAAAAEGFASNLSTGELSTACRRSHAQRGRRDSYAVRALSKNFRTVLRILRWAVRRVILRPLVFASGVLSAAFARCGLMVSIHRRSILVSRTKEVATDVNRSEVELRDKPATAIMNHEISQNNNDIRNKEESAKIHQVYGWIKNRLTLSEYNSEDFKIPNVQIDDFSDSDTTVVCTGRLCSLLLHISRAFVQEAENDSSWSSDCHSENLECGEDCDDQEEVEDASEESGDGLAWWGELKA
ncbi:mannosyltransferase putative-domain-containing protein [Cladochytrium replicatum]|nr:mannosyltransferase putative-domain-containing protein [Cladochytrium replicatum]